MEYLKVKVKDIKFIALLLGNYFIDRLKFCLHLVLNIFSHHSLHSRRISFIFGNETIVSPRLFDLKYILFVISHLVCEIIIGNKKFPES